MVRARTVTQHCTKTFIYNGALQRKKKDFFFAIFGDSSWKRTLPNHVIYTFFWNFFRTQKVPVKVAPPDPQLWYGMTMSYYHIYKVPGLRALCGLEICTLQNHPQNVPWPPVFDTWMVWQLLFLWKTRWNNGAIPSRRETRLLVQDIRTGSHVFRSIFCTLALLKAYPAVEVGWRTVMLKVVMSERLHDLSTLRKRTLSFTFLAVNARFHRFAVCI